MDEIELHGRVWRGMRRGHVGVFKDEYGVTYAGAHEGAKLTSHLRLRPRLTRDLRFAG